MKHRICQLVRDRAERLSGSNTLECWCAICSTAICKLFYNYGLQAILCDGTYDGMEHCWTLCEGIIYDVTATQFGIKRRIFETTEGNHNYRVVHKLYQFDSRSIRRFFREWPIEQQPKPNLMRKLCQSTLTSQLNS